MAQVTISLSDNDVKRVTNMFGQLEKRVRSSIARKAVRAGAAPIVKALRRNVPVDTKTMRRNITQKVKAYRSGASTVAIIGARNKKDVKTGRNPAKYLHLAERGTAPHVIHGPISFRLPSGDLIGGTSISHPGSRGHGFMAATRAQCEKESVKAFTDKFDEQVELALQQLK